MFEMFERFMARLRDVWDSMSLNQKVISGGVFVALFIALAYLSTLRDTLTEYTILFTELDAKSASEITSRLEQQNIPYKLSPDGSTIRVPRDQATQLKIDLTAEGLPEIGIVGYEILDTTTFGMSERIQEVNIQRALEGELSKTLMSLDTVQRANVRLSIPEPTLFTEIEKPTTAAVILDLRGRGVLSQKKIEGLTYFIAAAVPGLDPMNVTILDTEGNSLTKPYLDEAAMISGTQLDLKMQVDRYLADKAKSMLDAFGNSVVAVNAELNWDIVERTTTAYDQESSALVSEERITESIPSPDGLGELEESTINYETGQIIENIVESPGDISRLTVSVYIDWRDSTWVDGEGVTQVAKVPWSDNQIISMRAITENAVGFNSARGDMIEVEQIEFGVAELPIEVRGLTLRATVVEGIRALFIGIAIIGAVAIFFFTLRSVVSTLDPSKISMKTEGEFKKQKMEEEEEFPESERDTLVRKIVKTSKEDPETVAKTLKTFFKEE